MDPMSKRHVQPDQHNFLRNELNGQVQAMESAVTTPPYCPKLDELKSIIRLIKEHLFDVPRTAQTQLVYRKFETLKVHRPAIRFPP